MLNHWDDIDQELKQLLEDAGQAGLPLVPTLAAFAGDDPVALVHLRPLERDELLQGMIEVLALVLPLGADRIALATPGRAWSLDDPIPPVSDDVDLRQTVLAVTVVDAHGRVEPQVSGVVCAYRREDDGTLRFVDPLHFEAPEGPVTDALVALLGDLSAIAIDDTRILVQLTRCILLGHELAFPPAVSNRLTAMTAAPVG